MGAARVGQAVDVDVIANSISVWLTPFFKSTVP